ncbi:MAG: rhodanese-like domain-containing protein [Verrucomicrobia bacterium]|nr:rhodanese-like domain-containing protein [Verrucomicrobiota bacterium]
MHEVLEAYPGAQRALFRRYHIGGCSSCGFQLTETLEQLCRRNNDLKVDEALAHIQSSHEQDARILISPKELSELLARDSSVKLLDARSREEFEAVRVEGSQLLSQPAMQEIMGRWPRDQVFVIIDHQGKHGLDTAAYFLGHGFENVRCLRGGIDAWAQEIDPKLPRYRLEPTAKS